MVSPLQLLESELNALFRLVKFVLSRELNLSIIRPF